MARRRSKGPATRALPLLPDELWAAFDDDTGEVLAGAADESGSLPVFASHELAERFATQYNHGGRRAVIRLIGVTLQWMLRTERLAEAQGRLRRRMLAAVSEQKRLAYHVTCIRNPTPAPATLPEVRTIEIPEDLLLNEQTTLDEIRVFALLARAGDRMPDMDTMVETLGISDSRIRAAMDDLSIGWVWRHEV